MDAKPSEQFFFIIDPVYVNIFLPDSALRNASAYDFS